LRHSWASRALALGEALPVIGKLLGHSKMETTARYAHLARDSAQEAAERVATSIAEDILQEKPPERIAPAATGHRPAGVLPPRCGTTSG
ncbi:MAG: hypothetical protein OXE44_04855, partial [Nitrospinae bacterium]|nr:hypothetical protein [Nitrospinota bacterium]